MLLRLTKWHQRFAALRAMTLLLAVSLLSMSNVGLYAYAIEGQTHDCLSKVYSPDEAVHHADGKVRTSDFGNDDQEIPDRNVTFNDCIHCSAFLVSAEQTFPSPVRILQKTILIAQSPHSHVPPRLERPPKHSA